MQDSAHKHTQPMDANAVRAYAMATWPAAMKSPLASLFAGVAAGDEADRVTRFAGIKSRLTVAAIAAQWRDALAHARCCIEQCEVDRIAYDADTLSGNIESNFPELDADACDEIACAAIDKFSGGRA